MEFFFFLIEKTNSWVNVIIVSIMCPNHPRRLKQERKAGGGGQKLENWDSSITGSVHCGLKCRFDGTMGRCCWGDLMA